MSKAVAQWLQTLASGLEVQCKCSLYSIFVTVSGLIKVVVREPPTFLFSARVCYHSLLVHTVKGWGLNLADRGIIVFVAMIDPGDQFGRGSNFH